MLSPKNPDKLSKLTCKTCVDNSTLHRRAVTMAKWPKSSKTMHLFIFFKLRLWTDSVNRKTLPSAIKSIYEPKAVFQ